MEWFRIDDPVGAFPVHGANGVWGTLSLGLFACGKYGAPGPMGADDSAGSVVTGLFYGGGSGVLISQLIGNVAIAVATFAVSMVLMYAVKLTGTLRVSKEGELEGIDLHEHGGSAYPEIRLGGGTAVEASPTAPMTAMTAPVIAPAE
jgi:Amt family ammonium transporter